MGRNLRVLSLAILIEVHHLILATSEPPNLSFSEDVLAARQFREPDSGSCGLLEDSSGYSSKQADGDPVSLLASQSRHAFLSRTSASRRIPPTLELLDGSDHQGASSVSEAMKMKRPADVQPSFHSKLSKNEKGGSHNARLDLSLSLDLPGRGNGPAMSPSREKKPGPIGHYKLNRPILSGAGQIRPVTEVRAESHPALGSQGHIRSRFLPAIERRQKDYTPHQATGGPLRQLMLESEVERRLQMPNKFSFQAGKILTVNQPDMALTANPLISNEASSLSKSDWEERVFCLEDINPKLWAWFSIIWEYVRESIVEEVKVHITPHIPTLTMAFQYPKPGKYRLTPLGLLEKQVQDFAFLLWAVNLRTLEVLGTDRSGELYIQEQNALFIWFCHFALIHKKYQQIGISTSLTEQARDLYDRITEAIHCDEYKATYTLYRANLMRKVVSQKQVLMNQAVVLTLAFYYKNVNEEKWYQVFGGERKFALNVSNYGSDWLDRPMKELKRARSADPIAKEDLGEAPANDPALLPWREACTQALPFLTSNLAITLVQFDQFVIDLKTCSDIDWIRDLHKYGNRKEFIFGKSRSKYSKSLNNFKIHRAPQKKRKRKKIIEKM
ncbi:hypothetical protein PGTUg99_015131 [Puccinia graminis f. sp. tritici]|uniref:Uncharacterized protein n=1 Tax=Puccinia graminis f. sp. tritici TaxID=56615 RepID=A0A5B0M4T4_PUCGR|nr:hypothetical protein PGTUg99_015131 [Puccinia graminis f. sp. tritici]